jgi:hypothetical protein
VQRRGAPFFDQLVENLYFPAQVRWALQQLVSKQYGEADRIADLRGWGGAQPHGNDRYQYSLEQRYELSRLLPGAELLRPRQSLLYGIADALVYPHRYGASADDCPTQAQIEDSEIQAQLADGTFFDDQPTLFDPEPSTPRVVVWLLFTGNHVESGPLSAYLALPGGRLPGDLVNWRRIEPLLASDLPPEDPGPAGQVRPGPELPPEPKLPIRLLGT